MEMAQEVRAFAKQDLSLNPLNPLTKLIGGACNPSPGDCRGRSQSWLAASLASGLVRNHVLRELSREQ